MENQGTKNYAYIRLSPGSLSEAEQRRIILLKTAELPGVVINQFFVDDNTSNQAKHQLNEIFGSLREDDNVFVTSLDRIANGKNALKEIFALFLHNKAFITILDINLGTQSFAGRQFAHFLNFYITFDKATLAEARLRGIEKAKNTGKFLGRKPTAMQKAPEVLSLMATGNYTAEQVAFETGISPSSIRRIIRKEKNGELLLD